MFSIYGFQIDTQDGKEIVKKKKRYRKRTKSPNSIIDDMLAGSSKGG